MGKLFIRVIALACIAALLAVAITTANAGASAISNAYERQQSAERANLELHKLDYPASDNYVTDPMNGFDEEVYLQEQADKKEAGAHANAFLAVNNGGDK